MRIITQNGDVSVASVDPDVVAFLDTQAANEALATRQGRRQSPYSCRCGSGFETLSEAWVHSTAMHVPQYPPTMIRRMA